MFDARELGILISGSSRGFNVSDLREHTVYAGGYSERSQVIRWLWDLLQEMDPEERKRSASAAQAFRFSFAPGHGAIPDVRDLLQPSSTLGLQELRPQVLHPQSAGPAAPPDGDLAQRSLA